MFLIGMGLQPQCSGIADDRSVTDDLGKLSGSLAALGGGSATSVIAPVDTNSSIFGRFLVAGYGAAYTVVDSGGVPLILTDLEVDQVAGGVEFHSFEVVFPQTGNLTIELIPGTVDAQLDWVLLFENEHRAVAEAAPALTTPGNPVQLLSWVQDDLGNVLIGGAGSFDAAVRLPSGTSVAVPLYDDGAHGDGLAGDGIYGELYGLTGEEGLYSVTCQGATTISGEVVARTATSSFGILPSGASMSTPATETTPDVNNDGKYDALVLSYDLTLSRPGYFLLEGTLLDSQGAAIDRVVANLLDAAAGSHVMDLVVPGATIVRHGMDGPYTLTGVTLLDLDADTLPASTASDYVTQGYLASDFEAPEAPAITRMLPDEGHYSGGEQIVLHGLNLRDATEVRFSETLAVFEVTGDQSLLVTVPRLPIPPPTGGPRSTAPFMVDVEVVTPWGTAVSEEGWTSTIRIKR